MNPTRSSRGPVPHQQWLAHVAATCRGTVLDLGAGNGTLGRLLPAMTRWIALEPHPTSSLRSRVAERSGSRLLAAPAEAIPLEDASVDVIVCATVLCSVHDPAQVLREAHRVLTPEGVMHVSEHVAAPAGTWARRIQRLATPLTKLLDRGCDPCRDTTTILEASPFRDVTLTQARYPGLLGQIGPLIRGTAS
ncbi:MAG: class I SAM-dependent methyltransferase [Arachnia propionica]|uniref:class I SAM-dependent methyltransferase n=1 Tax=Arachnia propionica TaxID=1750 RepID=UPI002707C397|nr:class I SAM-dependent methyltransferase [Arachnia propionica]